MQESADTLTVSDHFTRLVWIDPNSPTLQRKGVPEKTTQDEDDDDEHEDQRTEEGEEDEDDSRTAYEQDNTPERAGKTAGLSEWDSGWDVKVSAKFDLQERLFWIS